jgi:hypothetical protein
MTTIYCGQEEKKIQHKRVWGLTITKKTTKMRAYKFLKEDREK